MFEEDEAFDIDKLGEYKQNINYPFDEFKRPENEELKIWRYMDFTRFISLLKESSLYFSRADKFEDVYEGTIPIINYDLTYKNYTERFKKELGFGNDKLFYKSFVQDEILEIESEYLLSDEEFINKLSKHHTDGIYEILDTYRKRIYINCWHMNDYESFAMWKIYAKNPESVAIQSTFSRLENCFNNHDFVKLGIVKYIDFNNETIPIDDGILNMFLHKTKFFQYENELRAITHDYNKSDGVLKKINLNTLIECVYISPNAPDWFEDLVKSVMNKYDIKNIDVKKSEWYNIKIMK